MAAPARVPDWLRPPDLPAHRMPSAQALQRLRAGNQRYQRHLAGEPLPPGDAGTAQFPFALVVGCLDAGAAGEDLFAERPGAVSCVRAAGPSLGEDVQAAVEYAALVHNVAVVLLLAHRGCAVLQTAAQARRSGVALPGALGSWSATAAIGTGAVDAAAGHVLGLRQRLRQHDSLVSLTRDSRLLIAAGVLDPATGAIEFLPDEPTVEQVDQIEEGPATPTGQYGS